jgi:hypothetical protein
MKSDYLQEAWEALLKAEEKWQLYRRFAGQDTERRDSLRNVVELRAIEFACAVKAHAGISPVLDRL